MTLSEELLKHLVSTAKPNDLDSICNIIISHIKNPPIENAFSIELTQLLSSTATFQVGIQFLHVTVGYFSAGTLENRLLRWTVLCLPKTDQDNLLELKLQVLTNLIIVGHHVPNFSRHFVLDHLPGCIKLVLVAPVSTHSLQFLVCCLQHFPSWFSTHGSKIEAFLIDQMDRDDPHLVDNAAKAFHFLKQTGNSGQDGVTHSDNFQRSFNVLCNTLSNLLDELFKILNIHHHRDEVECREKLIYFKKMASHLDTFGMTQILEKRVRNCLSFLRAMLTNCFSAPKIFKPVELLNVVFRGLRPHVCLDSEDNSNSHLTTSLSRVQCELMNILQVFIQMFGLHMLPFSYAISKVLISCIERTRRCECFIANSWYRTQGYETLCEWLNKSQAVLTTNQQQVLVQQILLDIAESKENVCLNIKLTQRASKGSKVKNNVDNMIDSNASKSSYNRPEINIIRERIWDSALRMLIALLTTCTLKVSDDLLRRLCQTIIVLTTNLQRGCRSSLGVEGLSNPCNEKLQQLLPLFYEQNIFPPLHTTVSLLGSSNELRTLEKLAHPVCASLDIPDYSRKQVTALAVENTHLSEHAIHMNNGFHNHTSTKILSNQYPLEHIDYTEPPLKKCKQTQHIESLTTLLNSLENAVHETT